MSEENALNECLRYLDEIASFMIADTDKNNEFMNKEHWGEGEWSQEPGMGEIIEFKYKDYNCIMKRAIASGSWCGYVAIPKTSKWSVEENYENLYVHGGVTYYSSDHPYKDEISDDMFWLGFDCSHLYDFSPRLEKVLEELKQEDKVIKDLKNKFPNFPVWKKTYRTLNYTIDELKKMIDQIHEDAC